MAVYRGKTLISSGIPSHDGKEVKGVFYMTRSKYNERLLEEPFPDEQVPPGVPMPMELLAMGIRDDCFYYVIEEADLIDLVRANWDEIVALLLDKGDDPADRGAVTFDADKGKLEVSDITIDEIIEDVITARAFDVVVNTGDNPAPTGAVTFNTDTGKLDVSDTTLAATIAAAITADAPGVIINTGANPKDGGTVTYNTTTGKLDVEQGT